MVTSATRRCIPIVVALASLQCGDILDIHEKQYELDAPVAPPVDDADADAPAPSAAEPDPAPPPVVSASPSDDASGDADAGGAEMGGAEMGDADVAGVGSDGAPACDDACAPPMCKKAGKKCH